MPQDAKLALRPDTWDALILDSVRQRAYGSIDVRGKVVIDIGAHIGAFSVLAAELGASRVLAYEPGDENFRLLAINALPYAAIEPFRAAVWRSDVDEPRLAWRASANAANTGGGTVIRGSSIAGVAVDARARTVDAIAFDAIVDRVGTVGLLKIDAEGSEYPILATSRRLDRVAAIVGEYHDVEGLDESMRLPGLDAWTGDALMDLLEARGFEVAVRPARSDGLFRAIRR